MKLTGKLVRIVGGREWELWREGVGHVGLQAVMRVFEGKEVVIEFVERRPGGASVLAEVSPDFAGFLGVDEGVAEALRQAGFRDLEDVRKATDKELLAVAGIGRMTLRSIREVTG